MFEYSISNQTDSDLFYRQCSALEKAMPGIKKAKLLEDVDGSLIQVYEYEGSKVIILNDKAVGALYIKSEIELEKFFN